MTSICGRKKFIISWKKNRHSWRLNTSNKVFLNQREAMDFHKLIFKFCKYCNEIGQKHFGPYLKNKVSFTIQSLEWELQEYLFKISSEKSDGTISRKNQENPYFSSLRRNINFPLKINCIEFFQIKNSKPHAKKLWKFSCRDFDKSC